MKNAIIWGAASAGQLYQSLCGDTFHVVGFADNDKTKQGLIINGVKCYAPNELQSQFDCNTLIIIASAAYTAIKGQLFNMGFTNIEIIDGTYVAERWKQLIKGYLLSTDATTYSIIAEDLIVDEIFRGVQTEIPRYAEIGVCTPIQHSNTYLFYERGGNGVLVEANPLVETDIRNARPNDEYYSVGIGAQSGEAEMFFSNSGVITFDRNVFELWSDSTTEAQAETRKVPIATYDDIFADKHIQYLSIDIEGWDEEVLCSIDFKKYPELLVVVSETRNRPKVRNHMVKSGFVHFATTRDNEVYLRERVLPKVLESFKCRRIYEFMQAFDTIKLPWCFL